MIETLSSNDCLMHIWHVNFLGVQVGNLKKKNKLFEWIHCEKVGRMQQCGYIILLLEYSTALLKPRLDIQILPDLRCFRNVFI